MKKLLLFPFIFGLSVFSSCFANNKFVVYFGGWEGSEFDLNSKLAANVTAVNLAFANITSQYQVDTAASGYLTNIPAPNIQLQPTYINWTTYKYHHPNTKIILSVGGATYSSIWTQILTPNSADTIARNIAKIVNQTYPAYKNQFSYPSDLLDNVTIDGVDIDAETGDVRLSETIANNVIALITDLRKYLQPGKLITLAGFSVGADPIDNCTVPGSVHCGENISILQQAGNLLDWVNVMAYDAGKDYATSKYQIALANYTKYLGYEKTVLGLDIQNQWPGFQETAAQLADKATWQRQHQFGGVMFWGVNVNNTPNQEKTYVDAISERLN